MTERFPPDCSSVSGRFRNTTFTCFGPSAASLALRAHSRGLRPPVLVLRLLRWRSALTPGACAPLFWSFGCFAGAPRSLPGLAPPCFGPSAASLALRAHSRGLRPPVLVLRLLRWRSALTPGACAPLFWSFDCFASLRAHSRGLRPPVLVLRLLRFASRSLARSRPVWLLGYSAVLQRARACEISQATGLCYAGGRSGARFFLPAPSISDLSVKELASA